MKTLCLSIMAAALTMGATPPRAFADETTATPSREERVREHQEKIEKIIEERRARKLEEAEKASREPGEGVMLVLGETLTWTEAKSLREATAADGAVNPTIERTLKASDGDRYSVQAGPYATKADALSAWRRLSQDMGYTFNTVRTSVLSPASASTEEKGKVTNVPLPSPAKAEESDLTTTANHGKISVAVSDVPVSRLIATLARESGKDIRAKGQVGQRRITLVVKDLPIEQILDEIVSQIPDALWYQPAGAANTYEIWHQDSFRREILAKKVVLKSHRAGKTISLDAARNVIGGMLTPGLGKVTVDPQFNNLIVVDLPAVQEKITEFLKQSGESRDDSSTHGSSGAAPANTPPPQP
ncbi:MAG: hypothetical protein K1X53_03955 [Candidatus Sumerlaeaceae bacterium]|nr:hypothetical protein [Candidatus Sumerlaeaceae bacterium]